MPFRINPEIYNFQKIEYLNGADCLPKTYVEQVMPYIYRHFDDNKKGELTFLDLAAGYSYSSILVKKKFPKAKVFASDISFHVMEQARKKYVSMSYMQMSANELAFPNSSIEVMHMKDALTHIYDMQQFFNEAHRVLKKSGILVLTFVESSSVYRLYFGKYIYDKSIRNDEELKVYLDYQNSAIEARKSSSSFDISPPFFGLDIDDIKSMINRLFVIQDLGEWQLNEQEVKHDWYPNKLTNRTKLVLRKI